MTRLLKAIGLVVVIMASSAPGTAQSHYLSDWSLQEVRHSTWRGAYPVASQRAWTRFLDAGRSSFENKPRPQMDTNEESKQYVAARRPELESPRPELETLFKKFVQWQ